MKKIARELEEAGYQRIWCQCCNKIKKLKSEYQKMKDSHGETGRKRKVWKFYSAIDDILRTKLATQPSVVTDTSKEDTREPVQTNELQLTEENVENDVEEMIGKELEYEQDKETVEVNEKESGKEASVNENEA